MLLEGSCHCGAVSFRVESSTPYPYQACYCSICRKTAGGGGYAINLGADANTLEVEGRENLSVYNAKLYDRGEPHEVPASEAERNFCRFCGSFLWLYDPRWPDLVHPFASAVDTPLPKPPERVHAALEFAAPWCVIPEGENERRFALWSGESIAECIAATDSSNLRREAERQTAAIDPVPTLSTNNPSSIPAKAGIHCAKRSVPPTVTDLPDYV